MPALSPKHVGDFSWSAQTLLWLLLQLQGMPALSPKHVGDFSWSAQTLLPFLESFCQFPGALETFRVGLGEPCFLPVPRQLQPLLGQSEAPPSQPQASCEICQAHAWSDHLLQVDQEDH